MTTGARWGRFAVVSAAGFAVQLATVAALTALAGAAAPVATAAGVTAAVLHNFTWHARWTWAERTGVHPLTALVRFTATNGTVSLAGNVAVVWLLVELTPIGPLPANVAAVGACSLVNFWAADRVVFRAAQQVSGQGLRA